MSKIVGKKMIFLMLIAIAFGTIFYAIKRSNEVAESYREKVQTGFAEIKNRPGELLTERDIEHLPVNVQRYIRLSGALGKEKLTSMRFRFHALMRHSADSSWMNADSEQYNFFENPRRIFLMRAIMFGLPVSVLHTYENAHARMLVKVLSLFPIVDIDGGDLDQAETVTLFNDMCAFAPGSLIDRRIQWSNIDANSVKATFTNGSLSIGAILYFNKQGELVNFVSDDRYYTAPDNSLKKMRWSTPLSNYQDRDGKRIATNGEAIWHFPEGDFVYGKFILDSLEYNPPGI